MEGTLANRLAENDLRAEPYSQRKRRMRSQGQLGAEETTMDQKAIGEQVSEAGEGSGSWNAAN